MNEILTDEFVVAVFDIDGFGQIAHKKASRAIFDFLAEMNALLYDALKEANPIALLPQGDATIVVFSKQNIDQAITTVFEAKQKLDAWLGKFQSTGVNCVMKVGAHYAEVTVGKAGLEPHMYTQALGNGVNVAFILLQTPWRGLFTISPELFRKLASSTRKIFKKYTPPIMYTATANRKAKS